MLLLVTVVEAGSFTGAAARLGKTKSAVSQGISRLEEDLGVILLHRTTRKLSLTEEGMRFHRHCLAIAKLQEAAVDEVHASQDEPQGTLVVTAPSAVSSCLIAPVLERYLKNHPKMAVELLSADQRLDLVADGIDLAIRVGQPVEQTARQSKLGEMRDVFCATAGYVQQMGGGPDDLLALAGWDHIASDWQGAEVRLRDETGRQVAVQPRIRCSHLTDSLQFVRQGLGVGLLPDFAIRKELADGSLIALQDPEDCAVTGIYALHIYGKHPPLRVSNFLEMLKQELRV